VRGYCFAGFATQSRISHAVAGEIRDRAAKLARI